MGTVTRKGQITIPRKIRSYLGLAALDQVEFLIREGDVVLKPVRSSVVDYRGFLKGRSHGGVPEDPETVREQVKREVARKAARHEVPSRRRR